MHLFLCQVALLSSFHHWTFTSRISLFLNFLVSKSRFCVGACRIDASSQSPHPLMNKAILLLLSHVGTFASTKHEIRHEHPKSPQVVDLICHLLPELSVIRNGPMNCATNLLAEPKLTTFLNGDTVTNIKSPIEKSMLVPLLSTYDFYRHVLLLSSL